MMRRRYPWSLACEKDTDTSALKFAQQLWALSPYFHKVKKIEEGTENSSSHNNKGDSSLHYNEHETGYLHMSLSHYPPEMSTSNIQILQGFTIISYFTVLVLLLSSVYRRIPVEMPS